MAQKLIHTVHSALQVVAHFQQLGFPLSVGPQQRVRPLDFLNDERWNPRLFEKAVHQPFVQSRQHHIVVGKSSQDHLDHLGVSLLRPSHQIDAGHRRHPLVGDHHIDALLAQCLHGLVRALCQAHVEVTAKGRIERREVSSLVVHIKNHRACHVRHDLLRPKRKASMLALSLASWLATSKSLLDEGLS